MLDWSQCPAVERSPDRVSGAWVFRGTRVPVVALFENLESGARVEEFLEWFPRGVKVLFDQGTPGLRWCAINRLIQARLQGALKAVL
jgi:hypothetical protein